MPSENSCHAAFAWTVVAVDLSHSDGLTGLSNRRYLDEYLSAEWRRGVREHSVLSRLMIDVDNFKLYNDTYGHVAGDDVL